MKKSFLIICIFILSSCGFKPMLAKDPNGNMILDEVQLYHVEGEEQPRLNRIISEQMGIASTPIYHLNIKVNEEISAIGITKDSRSTRYKVKVYFNYTLVEIDTQKTIDSGNIFLYSSYDVAQSEYANYIAERYTSDNILKELCDELKSRLILVISSRSVN